MVSVERYYENGKSRMMVYGNLTPVVSVSDVVFNKETDLFDAVDEVEINGSIVNVYFSFDLKLNPVGIIYNDYLEGVTLLNNLSEYNVYKEKLINYVLNDKEERTKRHAEQQEKFVKVRKKVPNEKR